MDSALSSLKDKHAFLSPSKISWLRYTDEKLIEVWDNYDAAERGTRLHAWAAETIELGIKQASTGQTLNRYINDAIAFQMKPEVLLFYSEYCFGTADALAFSEKKKFLRIHDLKTGKTTASMEQLLIYAALYCLQNKYEASELKYELRIYQNNEVVKYIPEPSEIADIMENIKHKCKVLEEHRGAM